MTIRKGVFLSYVAMTLIPLVLFISIAITLASIFFKEVSGETGSTSQQGGEILSITETFDNREQLFLGFKFLANSDTNRLLDIDFLREMDKKFSEVDAAFVIMKDDRITYASPEVDNENLDEQLMNQEKNRERGRNQKIDDQYTVEPYAFTFTDQSEGRLYLLSNFKPFFGEVQKFILILIGSLLLIIGLTNGLMTYLVSRSIIQPLSRLKRAAEQIKEGNLDQKLSLSRKDEFGEVGDAFEEMRERLKQSLQLQLQYEENRKELISNISHDLKTPVTGVKACIEGLRDGIANTEEKRNKYIRMMDSKITELDYMIDELFLFSKLDLNQQPFHFTQVDMSIYLKEYVKELRTDPQLKDVEIYLLHETSKSLYVLIDREKIQRVLQNIVNNSLRYMEGKKKKLEIWLDDDGEEVMISINDNGPGIEKEAMSHIFDRFYRVDPSRSKLTGGSGLGLAIVKQIMEEHGGRVWMESEVGNGTTVFLMLPVPKVLETGGEFD